MTRFALLLLVAFAPAAAGQAWPERIGDTPGYVHEYETVVAGWFGRTLKARDTGRVLDDREAVAAFLERLGLDADEVEYEQRSSHIAGVRGPRAGERADGFRYAVFVSAEPQTDDTGARLHRTWFRFRSPRDTRGVAVLMPGMLGTPHQFIDRFERALLGEGWAVLRMLVPPSRSTEYLPIVIDTAAPEAPIASLAVELDQRTAECAYAVEAGLAWADSVEPDLVGLPRVMIGMSGTGMMLPAVLARNREGVAAAVVIGSGANAFQILRETAYADLLDAVRVSWHPAPPTSDEMVELDAMYLKHAMLDAAALGPDVSDVPILLLHGSVDRAVPAESGDLLWECLGEPERWASPVGHELLFVRTLLRIPRIIDWLNERAADAEP